MVVVTVCLLICFQNNMEWRVESRAAIFVYKSRVEPAWSTLATGLVYWPGLDPRVLRLLIWLVSRLLSSDIHRSVIPTESCLLMTLMMHLWLCLTWSNVVMIVVCWCRHGWPVVGWDRWCQDCVSRPRFQLTTLNTCQCLLVTVLFPLNSPVNHWFIQQLRHWCR